MATPFRRHGGGGRSCSGGYNRSNGDVNDHDGASGTAGGGGDHGQGNRYNGRGRGGHGEGNGRGRGGRGEGNGRGRGGRGEGNGRGRGGRGEGSGRGRGGHQPQTSQYWSHEIIKEIATSNFQQILERIQNDHAAFKNALEFQRNLDKPYVFKWFLKILFGLVCNSTDVAFVSRIISEVFSDCAKFVVKLQEYLQTGELSKFFNELISIGRFCIENVPQSTIFKFPQSELKSAIEDTGEYLLLMKFQEYDCQYQIIKKEIRQQRSSVAVTPANSVPHVLATSDPHDQQPPDNFRDVAILPQSQEIDNSENKPFLRHNIIKGSYRGWDHYLDVHFRLLREDFMGPLRDGVSTYLHGNERTRDIQYYSDVRILSPVCTFTGIGFIIQFDVVKSRLSRVKWEHSRRLIYGSLLCLSRDRFQNVYFATVIDRDAEALQSGQLTVKFESKDINAFSIDPATKFEMVESTAYFEAYRHVLCRLQEIEPDQIPFRPYIVDGCSTMSNVIQSPLYLRHNSSLDLSGVLKLPRAKPPMNVNNWPHLPNTCLDDSQLKAFQMALSQEMSVIQGPPGTGKTFIGLKIVEALLHNRRNWDQRKKSPILVVCYTNHALDQFLEGVLELKNSLTGSAPKVVRVGGRCKNDSVKGCAMSNLVGEMRAKRSIPPRIFGKLKDSRNGMKSMQESLEQAVKAIDVKEGKILTVEELADIFDFRHYQQLIVNASVIPSEKILEYWLELWFLPHEDQSPDEEENGDAELALAMAESLKLNNTGQGADGVGGLTIEQEVDEDLIEVLDEPQLMEEDRITEGEQVILPVIKRKEEKEKQSKVTSGSGGWQVKQLNSKARKNRIKNGFKNAPMDANEVQRIVDIWKLTIKKKWQLYQYWLNKYIRQSKADLKRSADIYDICAQNCQEVNQEINCLTLENADVVGMTTTGAAKNGYLLKAFNPKIVIVEEAAEVLESHIITSLCSSVQQLILIGDHKQLQPKITNYELEKNYNLHISLFERLAENNFPVASLSVQHRMRPEIASIVGSHIYSRLENHESVLHYESIKGVGKDLFFIDHYFPEADNPTGDKRSHSNPFEANYIVALTRYLLKQGYDRSQITILTMYRGQLIAIKQNMRKDEFHGVRVAAVDDFQGEENDIIILSLVRSNNRGSIGFLKVENRVCVSLSRAKKGMFVVGNFSMLRDKGNTKWPAILVDMDKQGLVSDGLPLHCQNHPNEKVIARVPEDFSKCPEGGCQKRCNYRLECGHVCRSLCHPVDREHKEIYKCRQDCSKELPCGHSCTQKCFECSENGCSPCQINVERHLPTCGHVVRMKCSQPIENFKCYKRCNKNIPECGHRCQRKCYETCTPVEKCTTKVNKQLPCGHQSHVPCNVNESDFKCEVPCDKLLDCGHRCVGSCSKCFQGRLHMACQEKCERVLACGHLCQFPCTPNCPPCMEKCNNYCNHSQCPKLCYEPCVPCREPCEWSCPHNKCTAKCGEPCKKEKCYVACTKLLPCGHPCIGLCGEECPKLCRHCNKDEVEEIFFGTEDEPDARFIQLKDCGHIFEITSLDQWMETQQSAESQSAESHLIKFIECPKCKKPIKRSLRYGNIIKKTLLDIEGVKNIVNQRDRIDVCGLLQTALTVKMDVPQYKELTDLSTQIRDFISDSLENSKPNVPVILPHIACTISNILQIIPNIAKVLKCLQSTPNYSCTLGHLSVDSSMLCNETSALIKFIGTTTMYLTAQQIDEAKGEVQRLYCLARLIQLIEKINKENKSLEARDTQELVEHGITLMECGRGAFKCTDELQMMINSFLIKITNKYSIGGVSKEEMAIIVKAMSDITKGGWYKCPKGHIYAIGDCGGANQVGKCPDCGAAIGGTSHQLLPGNQHAGHVDNSSHAAWTEGANLANYDLNELQRMFQ